MEEQGKKKPCWVWTVVVALAVIVVLATWYFLSRSAPSPAAVRSSSSPAADTYQGQKIADIYSASVPQSAAPTPAQSVAAGTPNPSSPIKNRTYNLSVSSAGFNPSNIAVNAYDTITLEFAAVDQDYDLSIPYLGAYFYPVKKGQTKEIILSASAPSGVFTFECRDYCPPSGPVKGTLTVIPQKF